MNSLTPDDWNIFLTIMFLCWATAWIFLLTLGSLAVMAVIAAYDFLRGLYIARRNERLLADKRADIQARRAIAAAYKFGWVPRNYL